MSGIPDCPICDIYRKAGYGMCQMCGKYLSKEQKE